MRLEAKVAIVTGAAQGIGAAIASELAREGAVVYGIDRGPHIEATCASIRQDRGKAFGCLLDIIDHQRYAELVAASRRRKDVSISWSTTRPLPITKIF